MNLDTNNIVADVCRRYKIKKGDLTGPCRHAELVAARREVAECMIALGHGPSEIARTLKRNHSTVYNLIDPHGYKMRKQKGGHDHVQTTIPDHL